MDDANCVTLRMTPLPNAFKNNCKFSQRSPASTKRPSAVGVADCVPPFPQLSDSFSSNVVKQQKNVFFPFGPAQENGDLVKFLHQSLIVGELGLVWRPPPPQAAKHPRLTHNG